VPADDQPDSETLCEAPFINRDAQGMHQALGSADAFIND